MPHIRYLNSNLYKLKMLGLKFTRFSTLIQCIINTKFGVLMIKSFGDILETVT